MKFDVDYIEKIISMLDESTLCELELRDGTQSISMKKSLSDDVVVQRKIVEKKVPVTEEVKEEKPVEEVKRKSIVSPMVGTFYKAMSADAKPFVEVGQTIGAGQVVCIIEAMKLMNEIESEVSGRVVEICVEDGQPVEFGQVLMYLE